MWQEIKDSDLLKRVTHKPSLVLVLLFVATVLLAYGCLMTALLAVIISAVVAVCDSNYHKD